MTTDNTDRLTRWEKIRRDQLTFVTNLVLTLTVASFGFAANVFLSNDNIPLKCGQGLLYAIMTIAFLGLSIICGLSLSINRLIDFRKTVNKIRNDKNGENEKTIEMETELDKLGNLTWVLLWIQIIAFMTGGFVFSLYILHKL